MCLSLRKQLEDEKNLTTRIASHGTVDAVINPAQTRSMISKALEMLANKREKTPSRKHGNINL